jgi:hypothetical protein
MRIANGMRESPRSGRSESPLENREVRLRGLPRWEPADVHQSDARSVEAPFAERVSARRGLPQS